MERATLRVAVDTGGTFTDCVWIEDGRLRTLKVFSTPEDPSRAIQEAIRTITGNRKILLLHGTTVGTNALLERRGARVALLTTKGMEDAIEIGRQNRPHLYDINVERPVPLVPQELRIGFDERIAADGTILVPLEDAALDACMNELKELRFDAIAVATLFSFVNPGHERKLAKHAERFAVPISISSEVLPEFREYERISTTVVNAYLQPRMGEYLSSLAERMKQSRIFVMQSSGGIAALDSVVREPVRTVLSGPAGGVVGALAMAKASGCDKIIAFDMGGTSTDVALIEGELRTTNEAEIIGLPVRVPMLDIHTVGAGGGSIARFDKAGALRVGPESAGAQPGPICYGKGALPTVTDANVLLGRIPPKKFLGGSFPLDVERTRELFVDWLRKQGSDWSPERLAFGILRVVNANMERAIRTVSTERGFDPREFTLVAFGGAGPLHACDLAEALHIPRVLLPQSPGALSAYGILVSDVVKELSRTVMLQADLPHQTAIQTESSKLQHDAEKAMQED
ncbi:MAG: hydantoinase/oxoprolinase family protein, partial [Acidobacteriales bacterium]|nr:hydantoinase/oxoprolinase family protein [Terriglobales bacterium]